MGSFINCSIYRKEAGGKRAYTYIFNNGASRKFWEAEATGNMLIVRYGKIGTEGRVHIKTFASHDLAIDARIILTKEKFRKGYVGIANYEPSASSSDNVAIVCMNVGEHVWAVAKGLCKWLTKCLQEKIPPSAFTKMWDKYEYMDEARGVTGFTVIDGEREYWDILEFEEELPAFYLKAYEQKAEEVIRFDNNSYIDIVAIRGTPPSKTVAELVLTKENVGDEWTEEDTKNCLGDEYLAREKMGKKKP